MPAPVDSAALAVLLLQFTRGKDGSTARFCQIVRPILTKFANRFGWFLAKDQREEIVQQTFLLLRGPAGQAFDQRRGSVEVFLRLIARRAAREVGAMYTSPGSRTRPLKRNGVKVPGHQSGCIVSSIDDLADHDTPTVDGPDRIVEAQHDMARILASAPADVASALRCIYLQDVPVTRVAAEMGTSRYILDRKIDKFAETFGL